MAHKVPTLFPISSSLSTIPVSVKWLNRNFDCTLHGIKTNCGGDCCNSGPSGLYWPARAYGAGPNVNCGNRGPNGCVLPLKDKPAACMIFPLVIDKKSGRLVLYHRSGLRNGICKGNGSAGNPGPHLLDALKDGLVELLGEEQFNRLKEDVLAGRPTEIHLKKEIRRQLDREAYEEYTNTKPTKRSVPTGTKDWAAMAEEALRKQGRKQFF